MPASRSRTEHWSDCLRKIHERGGAIEIAVGRGDGSASSPLDEGADVVWRVKLLQLGEREMIVECPAAFGRSIELRPGVALIGAMTVGQNRWMFHTRTVGRRDGRSIDGSPDVLVLTLPDRVERCSRRSFYRISTANLRLPTVQCWPLMDPTSVVAAETANRLAIEELMAGDGPAERREAVLDPESILLPDVGPMFRSELVNVSGGGLGLRILHEDASALDRRPHLWMRINLMPHIPAPLAVTGRLAHTHIDSSQNVYAGVAFEFAFNTGHRRFVMDLLAKYVGQLQALQGGRGLGLAAA